MEGYLGQIMLYPTKWVPKNWKVCDGSEMETEKNLPLAVILGYSQDSPTFPLPIIDSPHSDFVYVMCINGLFPSKT